MWPFNNVTILNKNINKFLKSIQNQYTHAVTYYDNERINYLLSKLDFKNSFNRIDQGLDRTYEAIIDLRSA